MQKTAQYSRRAARAPEGAGHPDADSHYPIPPHLSEAYKHLGFVRGDFPLTERLAESVLSLPLYNGMAGEDIERVIDGLCNFG